MLRLPTDPAGALQNTNSISLELFTNEEMGRHLSWKKWGMFQSWCPPRMGKRRRREEKEICNYLPANWGRNIDQPLVTRRELPHA